VVFESPANEKALGPGMKGFPEPRGADKHVKNGVTPDNCTAPFGFRLRAFFSQAWP